MEQETQKELLKDVFSRLDAITEKLGQTSVKAWDAMMLNAQYEVYAHMLQAGFFLLAALVCTFLFHSANKEIKNASLHRKDDLYNRMWFLGLIMALFVGLTFQQGQEALRWHLAPEYNAVHQLIKDLR